MESLLFTWVFTPFRRSESELETSGEASPRDVISHPPAPHSGGVALPAAVPSVRQQPGWWMAAGKEQCWSPWHCSHLHAVLAKWRGEAPAPTPGFVPCRGPRPGPGVFGASCQRSPSAAFHNQENKQPCTLGRGDGRQEPPWLPSTDEWAQPIKQ